MNALNLVKAAQVRNQMQQEFPWLPSSLLDSLEQIANKKVVVPSLELDRLIHSVCLLSRVYNRLNCIMFENVGHCFNHRPACGAEPDELTAITSAPLSQEENVECEEFFFQLVERVALLEGESSIVNLREMNPGVYAIEHYMNQRKRASIVLQ